MPADTTSMSYNVAGTTALGDYLVSQIQNTRLLFGESPTTGVPAGALTASAPVTGGAAPTPATGASGSAASPPATPTSLAQDLAAARLANTQTLFGITPTAGDSPQAGALPTIAGQTPLQIEQVAIQSSLIAQQFTNISTLFSSIGLGGNVNRVA